LNQDFMLATDLTHGRIYQVSLQSGVVKTLDIPLVERPVTVIYDSVNKYIYWTEANSGKILRSRQDGKDISNIYSSGKLLFWYCSKKLVSQRYHFIFP